MENGKSNVMFTERTTNIHTYTHTHTYIRIVCIYFIYVYVYSAQAAVLNESVWTLADAFELMFL